MSKGVKQGYVLAQTLFICAKIKKKPSDAIRKEYIYEDVPV